MTFLNLLLIPVLWALGLFDGTGAGEGGADAGDAGAAGAAAKPTDSATNKPDAAKPNAKADEDLGDAGVKALEAFKARARAAEREAKTAQDELTKLREASQSESEKAVNDAKKTGADEERARWEGVIRRTRVESALTAAGCNDPDIAALAREFAELKVTDTGDVEELAATVETFKAAHPTLFTARVPSGSADQGAKPNSDAQVQPGLDRLRHAYTESSSTAKS